MLNDDDTKYKDGTQRVYSNYSPRIKDSMGVYALKGYKAYKINEVKLMVYNESDGKKLSNLTNMELFEKQEDLSDSESSDIYV